MLRIYNTLSRSVETFHSITPHMVGMYACGPTVYDYAHIGHIRRYVGDDILIKTLKQSGYKVKHVMNITDVGHLVSDADEGEDKMEKGARKHGMSVWDIAQKFEKQFFDSTKALGVFPPDVLMHATDYIPEQIVLITKLEKKGYTYRIDDGIYFDTSKFADYFKLSRQNPDELKAGARVELVAGKKHNTDFALWKFSPKGGKRQMEWGSPWGIGFPGWHIECSAMSMKALGETFDIHTGGVDHISIHHTNEIAQAEAATGKQFVNYWVHHNHLLVDGEKMSKSLGNFITVQDVIAKQFDPLALRYLYLQTHYRAEMNFTYEALEAAQKALLRLRSEISGYDAPNIGCAGFEERFLDALHDDLNTSKALAIVWELVKSDYPSKAKAESLKRMDSVLGLDLFKKETISVPSTISDLVKKREAYRKQGDYAVSDEIREKIKSLGYDVDDTKDGSTVKKIPV